MLTVRNLGDIYGDNTVQFGVAGEIVAFVWTRPKKHVSWNIRGSSWLDQAEQVSRTSNRVTRGIQLRRGEAKWGEARRESARCTAGISSVHFHVQLSAFTSLSPGKYYRVGRHRVLLRPLFPECTGRETNRRHTERTEPEKFSNSTLLVVTGCSLVISKRLHAIAALRAHDTNVLGISFQPATTTPSVAVPWNTYVDALTILFPE